MFVAVQPVHNHHCNACNYFNYPITPYAPPALSTVIGTNIGNALPTLDTVIGQNIGNPLPPQPYEIIKDKGKQTLLTVHRSIPSYKIISCLTSICNHIDTGLHSISLRNPHLIKLTKRLLALLSGDRELALLSSILSETEQISLNKVKPVFDGINDYLKSENGQNEQYKSKALQLISPHISWSSLESIGFDKKYYSTFRHSQQQYIDNSNKIKLKTTKRSGRKSIINNAVIQSDVYKCCIANADYQHEYILKKKSKKAKRVVYAKRLKVSKRRLFKRYNNAYKISQFAFYAIIKKFGEFKKPRKRTDLCDICLSAKQARKWLNERINVVNESIDDNMDTIALIDDWVDLNAEQLYDLNLQLQVSELLSPIEREIVDNKIKFLHLFLDHYKEYNQNKNDFFEKINTVQRRECVLVADYKEKIPVGHKKNEQNWVFRNLRLANCLGVIMYFNDETFVFDVVSNITNQTGLLSKCMINYVLHHPAVTAKCKQLGIIKIDNWFDCGGHFRNKSVLHYMFKDLPNSTDHDFQSIGYHNFTGKHGKSPVDAHFAFVSSAVDSLATTSEHGVQCSADIVRSIQIAVRERERPTKGISYYPINFDIDGPLQDSECMAPLQASDFIDNVLNVSQIKAFNHYLFEAAEQNTALLTEREVIDGNGDLDMLQLPSLRQNKYKHIDEVLLTTKWLLSDEGIRRYHKTATHKATKIKVAKKVITVDPNVNELKRKSNVRKSMMNDYNAGNKRAMFDIDTDGSSEHDEEESIDSDDDPCYEEAYYKEMKKKELKKLCRERGLKRSGKKALLIQRLLKPNKPANKSKKT